MNFHDDPQRLLTELDQAWAQYTSDFDLQMTQLLSSIVSWRWATDDMFPSHPLFGLADTTMQAEPWQPFDRRWLRDDEAKVNTPWQHGFDSQGRIVLARNEFWGKATFWRVGGCDRLTIHESKSEAGRFIWGMPRGDSVGIERFWYDKKGRIECMCDYLRGNDAHHRTFEWFAFEGNRCIESIKQSFEIMSEIPHYQQDKSEAELRADYRPLQGNELVNNLVETMFMRSRIKYSYSSTGELLKAEEFRADGEPVEELLFEKPSEGTLEETMDRLAGKIAETIEKAVKKRSTAKPYRGLILIYSAEHAHCGLPHQVAVLGHEAQWPKDRFYHENYTNPLDVEFKRPAWSLLNEFNQRCYARYAMDEFAAQTAAAVSVMKKIAEQLHGALDGTKHVADDFAVLVIDDHGDVDNFAVPA